MIKKVILYVMMVSLILSVSLHAEEVEGLDLVQVANDMTIEVVSKDFNQPGGLAIDSEGGVLVADTVNNRIMRLKDGKSETVAGTIATMDIFGFPLGALIDGEVTEAYFNHPRDLVIGSDGSIYVADTDNHAIRLIKDGMVTTIAGSGIEGGLDGSANTASFSYPSGITMDTKGDLYVADTLNNAIRKVTQAGLVTTLELTSSTSEQMDHLLNEPSDVWMDKSGVLYILDSGNQQIKKVVDGLVTVVSGMPAAIEADGYRTQGFRDGFRDEATYNFPKSIMVYDGVIYLADTWNNAIRIIKADGQTTTLIGSGVAGDQVGSIASATLNGPSGLAVMDHTLYITDRWNNAVKSVDLSYGNRIYDLEEAYVSEGSNFILREDGQINIAIDQTQLTYKDVEPVIFENHSYVPVRAIGEKLGASVDYDPSTRSVELSYKGEQIVYPLESDYMIVRNNRALIPIRKLATDLGFFVTWLDDTRTVVIKPIETVN